MSERRNVPKLRFAGFSELWETKRLDSVFDEFKSGEGITSKEILQEGSFPVYGGNGLRGFSKRFTHEGEYLLIGRQGALCGNINLVDGKNFISEHAIAGRANQYSNTKWLAYRMEYLNLNRLSESSAHPGLSVGKLLRLKLTIPKKVEQQKIATFLTAVDRRIGLLEQKKAKLEAYKKGVMQQLFSRQIRFKQDDGSDFPDWEEKKLGEVLDYEQPTKYLVANTEYRDEYKTPVLTAGKTFLLGYTDETTGIFVEKLPTIIFDDFTTAFQFVDFPFKAKSSAMKMLIPKSTDTDMIFVFEVMQQIDYVPGDHKRHWISEYQEFKIPFPSQNEQIKIVGFASKLNSGIKNLEKQINQTQTWKKGLLQQMFV